MHHRVIFGGMISVSGLKLILIAGLFMVVGQALSQASVYAGKKEIVPNIPSKGERMRVVIVSDAMNEIDDLWAISLALLSPERFRIEGFVGSNFDHTSIAIGRKGIEMSVKAINTLLSKAGMSGDYPVYHGSHPMQYEFEPSMSEGVEFIIEKALEGSPADPLWIIGLGSPTDIASAYLKEPSIKDKIVVFWHARTEETWPFRAHNYNIKGDMHASRIMFHAPFPLVLFDTGSHLFAGTLEESEKYVKPYGELGAYLYHYRLKDPNWSRADRGFFDLGDISVLIDPALGKWEEIRCPTVTQYMDYNFLRDNGQMLRCYDVDRNQTYQLLYDKLKAKYTDKK